MFEAEKSVGNISDYEKIRQMNKDYKWYRKILNSGHKLFTPAPFFACQAPVIDIVFFFSVHVQAV